MLNDTWYIINANIVNEGRIFKGSIFIKDGIIKEIVSAKDSIHINTASVNIIDATGKYLFPGIIDAHVHFREPGLTHKADIYTESKAAVAGGVTSFMEMPNTIPNVTTIDLLEEKYRLASEKSLANYSFFIGATNTNINEILQANPREICGVKIFMGTSTDNILVDDNTLNKIFSKSKLLIATHCEDEKIIQNNLQILTEQFGDDIPISFHPLIRSEKACYKSTAKAIALAKKFNSRLHILHLSTAKELALLDNSIQLKEKNITSEVCTHHLWFDELDYSKKGMLIKCNPAIKNKHNKDALMDALLKNKIDIITSDHAPHTLTEKNNVYTKSPSGIPLIQHSLPVMLEFYHQKKISLEMIVEKMCHAPAICYGIVSRGFVRKGYKADLILLDINKSWIIDKTNILYKCAWSPFEGYTFTSKITHTFVNGILVFENGVFNEKSKGKRLIFQQ